MFTCISAGVFCVKARVHKCASVCECVWVSKYVCVCVCVCLCVCVCVCECVWVCGEWVFVVFGERYRALVLASATTSSRTYTMFNYACFQSFTNIHMHTYICVDMSMSLTEQTTDKIYACIINTYLIFMHV